MDIFKSSIKPSNYVDAFHQIEQPGSNGPVFTGSADESIKAWQREGSGKAMRHSLAQTLLEQECAVTVLHL
jgi:hypothetical protein